jgi:hypothetical protein
MGHGELELEFGGNFLNPYANDCEHLHSEEEPNWNFGFGTKS